MKSYNTRIREYETEKRKIEKKNLPYHEYQKEIILCAVKPLTLVV